MQVASYLRRPLPVLKRRLGRLGGKACLSLRDNLTSREPDRPQSCSGITNQVICQAPLWG